MKHITVQETKYGITLRVRTQHEQFNNTERVYFSMHGNKEVIAERLKSIAKEAVANNV